MEKTRVSRNEYEYGYNAKCLYCGEHISGGEDSYDIYLTEHECKGVEVYEICHHCDEEIKEDQQTGKDYRGRYYHQKCEDKKQEERAEYWRKIEEEKEKRPWYVKLLDRD